MLRNFRWGHVGGLSVVFVGQKSSGENCVPLRLNEVR